MGIAKEISTWSKDPSTKVGAVIVRDNRILSCGYNGFPSGVEDDNRLSDRETKYRLTIHAEVNAILNAAKNGIILNDSTLYVYGLPVCVECAKSIVQSGISKVAMVSTKSTWDDSFDKTQDLCSQTNVNYSITKGE